MLKKINDYITMLQFYLRYLSETCRKLVGWTLLYIRTPLCCKSIGTPVPDSILNPCKAQHLPEPASSPLPLFSLPLSLTHPLPSSLVSPLSSLCFLFASLSPTLETLSPSCPALLSDWRMATVFIKRSLKGLHMYIKT